MWCWQGRKPNIVSQVLAVLLYMNHHKPKIIHYDLKPSKHSVPQGRGQNFCLLTLQDSRLRSDSVAPDVSRCGHLLVPSPDDFTWGGTTISTKVDVWSLWRFSKRWCSGLGESTLERAETKKGWSKWFWRPTSPLSQKAVRWSSCKMPQVQHWSPMGRVWSELCPLLE